MNEFQLIERNPDLLGGTPVFAGTPVPVRTLIDYIVGGDSLDDFLDDFPTLQPLMPKVIAALPTIRAGGLLEIAA
jgi:uncharacterized protein (DUF433 family)